MNFINVNWNGTAFVGNPIPSNKHIPESLETSSYNPSFTGVSHGYSSHFDTVDASISSSKTSPVVSRNSVREQTYYILEKL